MAPALKPGKGQVDTFPMTNSGTQEFDGSFDLNAPFDSPDDEPATYDPAGQRPSGQKARNGRLLKNYMNRPSPWTRALKWFIGLLVVAGIAHEIFVGYYDRKMTNAIREVSGQQDIEVHCRRVWDEVLDFRVKPGFVWFGSGVANLQLEFCRNAAAWPDDPTDDDKRIAIMVLTHELAHVANHFNESETECVAMWALPKTAVALGGDASEGAAAAEWYSRNYNPLLPPEYNAPGCLEGSPPVSPLLR